MFPETEDSLQVDNAVEVVKGVNLRSLNER